MLLDIAFILLLVVIFLLITESRPLSSFRWACVILWGISLICVLISIFGGNIHIGH
jgi:hypothetical protein